MSIDPLQLIAAMRAHRASLNACEAHEGDPFNPYEPQAGPNDELPVKYSVCCKHTGDTFTILRFEKLHDAQMEANRQNHIHNMGVTAGYAMALAELEAKLKAVPA